MNTPDDLSPQRPFVVYRDASDLPPTPPPVSRWRRLRGWTAGQWVRLHMATSTPRAFLSTREGWKLTGFVAGVVAAALLVLWLLVTLIASAVHAISHPKPTTPAHAPGWVTDAWQWLTHGPITRTITDPVHHYIDTHAVGLPITGGQAWTLWLVAAGVLFGTALLGVRSARIGWAVLGALTAAAVYAGTTGPGRALAAGVTALVWSLLTILTSANPVTLRMPTIVVRQPAGRGPADAAADRSSDDD